MATTDTQLMTMSPAQLDELFASSPPGVIPEGRGRGTVVLFPGTAFTRPLAAIFRALFWQGKVFRAETHDLVNLLSPLGRPAVRADVRPDESIFDGRPCILLDYSTSSRAASDVRDEIRQIGDNEYLGLVYRSGRKLPVYFTLTFAPPAHGDPSLTSPASESAPTSPDPHTQKDDGRRRTADATFDTIE